MEAAREVPLESGDLSDAGRDISELRKYIGTTTGASVGCQCVVLTVLYEMCAS